MRKDSNDDNEGIMDAMDSDDVKPPLQLDTTNNTTKTETMTIQPSFVVDSTSGDRTTDHPESLEEVVVVSKGSIVNNDDFITTTTSSSMASTKKVEQMRMLRDTYQQRLSSRWFAGRTISVGVTRIILLTEYR